MTSPTIAHSDELLAEPAPGRPAPLRHPMRWMRYARVSIDRRLAAIDAVHNLLDRGRRIAPIGAGDAYLRARQLREGYKLARSAPIWASMQS